MKQNTQNLRRSILVLQNEYEAGINNQLEKVMTAWAYIKALPPTDPNSFFTIGGYHGEPFAGEGATNPQWWGGYCNHANVLFPTWHRAYLYKLELALQTTPGCEDVTLPYWDETDDYSTTYGIPHALTDQYFTFREAVPECLVEQGIWCEGSKILNPLASFTFTAAVTDTVTGDLSDYSKPLGYQTVRYPLSGLVGSPAFQAQTTEHNAMFPDYNTNAAILNANVLQWLNNQVYYVPDANFGAPTPNVVPAGIAAGFKSCLNAPNYTAFSNTQSAGYYNSQPNTEHITPLEQPHNDIHLSVGGFNLPATVNNGGPNNDLSQIPGANGDMGENDTAGLDPIFFFHHCNVDRMFWLWQVKQGCTDEFDIIADSNDPGTSTGFNGGYGQGPANGQTTGEVLTMQTELKPFAKPDGSFYASNDCINIETQLNYSYSEGSLADETPAAALTALPAKSNLKLHISELNRGGIHGSFIVAIFSAVGSKNYLVGYHSVLSRWKVGGCSNCQVHLNVLGAINLSHYTKEETDKMEFHAEIIGREEQNKETFGKLRALASTPYKPYKLEVK